MKALKRVVDEVDETNLRIAMVCCLLVDEFRTRRTPALLEEAQDFIRLGLRTTRVLINVQRDRDSRRRAHFNARGNRAQGLLHKFDGHVKLLTMRKDLLERRRKICRAAADALAWLALSNTPGAIPRLFRPQTHELPTGTGLIGHLAVQNAAHGTDRFLVIENDLTRCLGLGDLTVVPLVDPQLPPISVEVKAHRDADDPENVVHLDLALVEADHPRAKAALKDFHDSLGLPEGGVERPAVPDTKQLSEFFEQASDVIRQHGGAAPSLGIVDSNWDAVDTVLRRAVPGLPSLDIAEEGVWFGGVAVTEDRSTLENDFAQLQERAVALIPRISEEPLSYGNTYGLEAVDTTGALTVPIAVWKLPIATRARLLNGDLILLGFVEYDAVRRRAEALEMEAMVGRDEWRFSRSGVERVVRDAMLSRVRLDLQFGSLQLSSLVARIREAIDQELAAQEQSDG